MESAFWDSSSLVPLCVTQPASSVVRALSAQYEIHVWWAAPVEVKSAFARLLRMGLLTQPESAAAQRVLEVLRSNWSEVLPAASLRTEAESYVNRFQLR